MLCFNVSAKLVFADPPAPPAPIAPGAAPPPVAFANPKLLETPVIIFLAACCMLLVACWNSNAQHATRNKHSYAINLSDELIIALLVSIIVTLASYARDASSMLTYSIERSTFGYFTYPRASAS